MRAAPWIVVFGLMMLPAAGLSQIDRGGSWEIGGTLLDLSSADIAGVNGSRILVDDETGYGFAGAYNFTDRLAIGLDISFSDPAYLARLVPEGGGAASIISTKLGVDVIHFKGIFNLLDAALTPYVELGGGWTYVDSNIVQGISGPVCWWDPWWGYVCNRYFETYTETQTSHAYAAGLRWDIDADLVFRAGWGRMEIDTNRASEDIELDTIQLTFAWRF